MKNIILAGLLMGAAHGMTVPVMAEPTKGYYTMDAMGCMLLRECKKDVHEIKSIDDLQSYYPDSNYDVVAAEFNTLVRTLNEIGTKVFLGNEKYFPPGHRGVYHTVSNNFYLNTAFMHRASTLMSVMRHEGWHAAQDCMAGTIKNNMIAIIKPEEDVPMLYREMVKRTYMPAARPWEAEASWAGRTDGMTQKALESCARGTMWTDYEPTPLTKKWLKENGYIK